MLALQSHFQAWQAHPSQLVFLIPNQEVPILEPFLSEVAAQDSIQFVREYFPNEGAKILQIGCGKGLLASELQKVGYLVTGLDTSSENVDATKTLGINAHLGDILDFSCEESFDAVLFTRSLQSVNSIETVLNKVKKLLNDKGRILIEDFAVEQMDNKTATWFYELRDLMGIVSGMDSDPNKLASIADPVERWKAECSTEPSRHSRKDIVRVMERNFGAIHSSAVPYLYRYFESKSEVVHKIFAWETKAIEKKLLEAVGFRIAAKKYFSYLN